jgi:DNA repair exonuclease SbcCD ATPase subunit
LIVFQRLTFQNFLSVGNNPVTINLNQDKTTLVYGTNGSGKSSILDAITYALFNKPFRKINLPQLVNTQNKKGLLVEVEFSIGKNVYVVSRGMKPKVFTIMKNGEPLQAKAADKDNQAHLEQNILKLTYKSFCQVVILGSSNYIPFMQLPSAGRRECVEDFLDIKVFSTMSVIAKERLRGLKDNHTDMEYEMNNLEYKIDLQREQIKQIEDRTKNDIDELEVSIQSNLDSISKIQSRIESVSTHEKNVISLAQEDLKSNPAKKLKQLNDLIVKMGSKIEKIDKDTQFYNENDECPTCCQNITEEAKSNIIKKNETESSKLRDACIQAEAQMDDHQYLLRLAAQRQKHVQSLQKSIFQYQTQVDSLQKEINSMENKVKSIRDNTSSVDKEIGKLEMMEEDQVALRERIFKIEEELRNHNLVVDLLKDGGIKAQIVKKYLPIMNNCIRSRLTDLDMPVHFVLDEEFNEHVSSPMYQNFSYASFSEGQKARIDLALMFTWREIGKTKNSVSTNLLILDEVFSSSLDEVGKDNLMKMLRYDLDDSQRVLVVDHTLSSEFKDKFDRTIEVQRVNGFSRYN